MKKNLLVLPALLVVMLMGCSEKRELTEMPSYEGPLFDLTNITTVLSDSAIVRVRLKAPRQLEFESGDREFPEGLHMEFLEIDGHASSTVDANVGYYYKDTGLWKVVDNVVLLALDAGDRLTTEELWWDPEKEEVFTPEDVKVTIREGNDIITGYGLQAKQDFSEYELLQFEAETVAEDEEYGDEYNDPYSDDYEYEDESQNMDEGEHE